MRILIADDDPLTRKLLQSLLVKLGHEVEVAVDGESALRGLDQPNPPPLALMDWIMPGLSGPEVCKRVRAAQLRSRTYIILLSSKSEKDEVVAGLDAGADDYLVKPFNPMELLARLRVAQRTIQYQQQLQRTVDEMQLLLQRYNLLGEMFGKHGRTAEGEVPALADGQQKVDDEVAFLLRPARINAALSQGLAEIGLADSRVSSPMAPAARAENGLVAWSGLALVNDALWLDLLVETDPASATMLFKTLLGRASLSDREQLDFLAETFNLLCAAIRNSLQEHGIKVLTPGIARSVRSSAMNFKVPVATRTTLHQIDLPGAVLHLTIQQRHSPVVSKSLGQLNELDLLAENLPSPSAADVFLLNQGVTLNSRYIEKLCSLAQSTGVELRIPVIEPSALAEFFSLGRIPAVERAA